MSRHSRRRISFERRLLSSIIASDRLLIRRKLPSQCQRQRGRTTAGIIKSDNHQTDRFVNVESDSKSVLHRHIVVRPTTMLSWDKGKTPVTGCRVGGKGEVPGADYCYDPSNNNDGAENAVPSVIGSIIGPPTVPPSSPAVLRPRHGCTVELL